MDDIRNRETKTNGRRCRSGSFANDRNTAGVFPAVADEEKSSLIATWAILYCVGGAAFIAAGIFWGSVSPAISALLTIVGGNCVLAGIAASLAGHIVASLSPVRPQASKVGVDEDASGSRMLDSRCMAR